MGEVGSNSLFLLFHLDLQVIEAFGTSTALDPRMRVVSAVEGLNRDSQGVDKSVFLCYFCFSKNKGFSNFIQSREPFPASIEDRKERPWIIAPH
jgi:hypothetical protein